VLVFAVVLAVGWVLWVAGSWVVLGHPAAVAALSEERHRALILASGCLAYLLPPALWCTRPVVLAANYRTFLLDEP
jgi:uncharacterized membrane protein